jgi:hypothetical protein
MVTPVTEQIGAHPELPWDAVLAGLVAIAVGRADDDEDDEDDEHDEDT